MEILGKIRKVFPTEEKLTKLGNTITERKIVVEIDINTQYPQKILFLLKGERVRLADEIREGDDVKILYRLKSIEYEKDGEINYYTYLECLGIQKLIFEKVGNNIVNSNVTTQSIPTKEPEIKKQAKNTTTHLEPTNNDINSDDEIPF